MRDVVHPDVELPAPARLRQLLERGEMVLDVLLKQGVPVAYNAHALWRACSPGATASASPWASRTRPRRSRSST